MATKIYIPGLKRRDFLYGATALGLAGAAGPTILGKPAHAAPQKGGRLRVGLAEGSSSDSLDPQTYTDIYMI